MVLLCLLLVAILTVAIFKMPNGSFRIFDARARDLFAVPNPFGKCILFTISNIQELDDYFQSVSPVAVIPFELKGVSICVQSQQISHSDTNPAISQGVQNQQKWKRKLETLEQREKRLSKKREYAKHSLTDLVK